MKKDPATLPNISTVEGQSLCLQHYGVFSSSYACRAGSGKSAVWPTYCNGSYVYSTNVNYVRAADTLCCPTQCHWTQDDLLTSYGENKCLNLESSGWTNWDCNGLSGRSAAVPSYCKTTNSNYKRAVHDNCCRDECSSLEELETKSIKETQCLHDNSYGNWTGWDCEGIAAGSRLNSYTGWTRKAAAPGFCNHTNNCDYKKAVNLCCSNYCAKNGEDQDGKFYPDLLAAAGAVKITRVTDMTFPDINTVDGQSKCLTHYGVFSTSYACRAGSGKSAVWPTYCNGSYVYSNNVNYVRAADTLCCKDDCHWTQDDLLTSYGENKCLNLESSGWTNWDCNGLSGRSAAVPSYCKTTNSNYKRAVHDNCCYDECAALAYRQEKSEAETQCLHDESDGNWTGWDCEGITAGSRLNSYTGWTRKAAAPGFCNHTNNCDYKKAVNKCCAKACKNNGENGKYYPDLIAAEGVVKITHTKAITFETTYNLSTVDGQSRCLADFGGFSSSYACRAGSGKSSVFPTYCNGSYVYSSNSNYVRATDTLCCKDDCRYTDAELDTSDGQNKCLNLESSGWTNWDCEGKSGRSAATPSYCTTTNSNYRRAMDACCSKQCSTTKIPQRAGLGNCQASGSWAPPAFNTTTTTTTPPISSCSIVTTPGPPPAAVTTTSTPPICGHPMGVPTTTTTTRLPRLRRPPPPRPRPQPQSRSR